MGLLSLSYRLGAEEKWTRTFSEAGAPEALSTHRDSTLVKLVCL
jgi:hypothetical protein